MECYLCPSRLYRHEVREHILERHKKQEVYQCGRCDYVTTDLRISMVEHMTIGHQVTDPLCENVHFRHLSCGELMKRMLCEAPNSIDSDQESLFSIDMDNIPSPDSACPDLVDSRVSSPKPSVLVELAEERSPDSGVVSIVSETPKSSDLEVGQVVWVWMSGYPIWPGIIAPAPATDLDHDKFMRVKEMKVTTRTQYHCQFFGTTAERSWINSKAILPWEETMSPQDQFEQLTKQLVKIMNIKKKEIRKIKSEVPRAKKESWARAVKMAESALNTADYTERLSMNSDPVESKMNTSDNKENKIKETKTKKSKRKSILPSSLTYKITPHKDLNYRECNDSTFDADLHIPDALWNQENNSIPAEIVTGPEFYESKITLHSSRTISKDLALRACTALKLKVSENQLKSPEPKEKPKKSEKEGAPEKEKPKNLEIGSKCEDIAVCMVCELIQDDENDKPIVQCTGVCKLFYHYECDNQVAVDDEPFICSHCRNESWPCFICNNSENTVKCADQKCGRFYHKKCLELDKFAKGDKCPLHSCHTCTSRSLLSSVNANEAFQTRGKMFQCIRCPAAYHYHGEKGTKGGECIPAGSLLVGGKYIVCPAHFKPRAGHSIHQTIHVNQCFKCFQGGELVICDRCPAAYHEYCLDQQPATDGAWYCDSCTKGHQLCYNDIVWVKMGRYQWWPSEVVHPTCIPANLECMPHGPGEFVTRFLGTNEYYWVNQRRCFLYKGIIADPIAVTSYNKSSYLQQSNNDKKDSKSSKSISIKNSFTAALIEAEELYDKQQGIGKYKANGGSMPFSKISKNSYYPSFPADLKKKVERYMAEMDRNECECHTRGGDCSEYSQCENRGLLYECNSDCRVTDCKNRKFTKKQYPPLIKFKTSWGGFGLKAKELIPADTFVIEYVGEIIDVEESRKRLRESGQSGVTNYYILSLDKDRLIDAGPRGNLARFINHSCGPNCFTEPWIVNQDVRVGIFAKVDIQPGEELTFNYQLEQHGEAKTKCLCGADTCAGFIGDKATQPTSDKNDSKKSKTKKYSNGVPHRGPGRPPKNPPKMKPLSVLKQEVTNGKKRRVSSTATESTAKRRKL